MRKSQILLPEVKAKITRLKGKPVRLLVHEGRQKYRKLTGVLDGVYPSLFTVRLDHPTSIDRMACSYSEVLCGKIRLAVRKSPSQAPTVQPPP